MKPKNNIQIVETPIIDKYDFQENNGIINPAFLDSHPGEEDNVSSQALVVDSDYRQCFHHPNSQSAVQYPADELIIEHRPNGTSVASSWVYEFNHGCTNSPGDTRDMTSSPHSANGMYRPAYGMTYNDHLSYEMDLSRDHRNNKEKEARCWPSCIKLFVWTVIVVCLMGVFLSVAFIIYIERFAADTCCSDSALNSTGIPGQHGFSGNVSTEGMDYSSERVTDSTPALVDSTIRSGFETTLSEVKITPKETTNSYFETNSDNSSDLWTVPNSPITTVLNGQNESQELNATEVPLISETTKTGTNSETLITVPSTTLITSITTHSVPTTTLRRRPTTLSPFAPTLTTENPIYKTTKSPFDSRVLSINSSQTQELDINSSETTDQMNESNKSEDYSSATTSSPEERTTTNGLNETTTHVFDIVAEERPKSDPTPNYDYTTSAGKSDWGTPSTTTGSDYTTAYHNQYEPAINHEVTGNKLEDSLTTRTITTTAFTTGPTTTAETTTTPTTTSQPFTTESEGEDQV